MSRYNKQGETINARVFADAVTSGATLHDAMIQAGYSEESARAGRAKLSGTCLKEWAKALMDKVVLGQEVSKQVDTEQLRHLVRGKIIENVVEGRDKAPQSLKLAAQLKETSMLGPDTVAGVIFSTASLCLDDDSELYG